VRVLETARQNGVSLFAATDAITVRHAGENGAADPHFWTDPLAMNDAVAGLATFLEAELHLDMKGRAADLEARLAALDGELVEMAGALPESRRQLITGHESLGYFAARYNFRVLGSIVPGLTTEAEASAADVAALQGLIRENQVAAVFSELGTSPAVAEAIGRATGARVITLTTHALPGDGSYFTYERELMRTIVEGLS